MTHIYQVYDSKGNVTGFQKDSVVSIEGDFSKGTAKVLSIVSYWSKKDTLTSKGMGYMIFKDGEVITDMAKTTVSALEEIETSGDEEAAQMAEIMSQTEVVGESRGIPSDISVGMALPDYSVDIKIMIINMKYTCENRKVVAQEKITTPAGTFDCYVVEETNTTKAMMQKETVRDRTWYACGIGTVKQESLDKKGNVTESMVLTEISGM